MSHQHVFNLFSTSRICGIPSLTVREDPAASLIFRVGAVEPPDSTFQAFFNSKLN